MAKRNWLARCTEDHTVTIQLGALVIVGLNDGATQEIAPPREHHLHRKAGEVYSFRTKRDRDAFLASDSRCEAG
jgi:hypothetical protein